MPRKSHHIVPNSEGGWDIRLNGSKRSSGHFQTKREAIDNGREISRNQGSELVIHGLNGQIQQSDSHGNDPRSTKG